MEALAKPCSAKRWAAAVKMRSRVDAPVSDGLRLCARSGALGAAAGARGKLKAEKVAIGVQCIEWVLTSKWSFTTLRK
jgi:hypothetical protein